MRKSKGVCGKALDGPSGQHRAYAAAAVAVVESLPANSTVDIYTHEETIYLSFARWLENWEERDWKKPQGDTVKAQEIFARFLSVTRERNIHWKFRLISPGHKHFVLIEKLRGEVNQRFEMLEGAQ